METTAKTISDWALGEIKALAAGDFYASKNAMYGELSRLAGVSRQTVRQFHVGSQPNLSTDTLDRVVSAIKAVKRLRAA